MNILRIDEVKEYIESKGEATLIELKELFQNCSSMTLRRDLIKLEQQGYIKRTRGGAIALNQIVGVEGLYSLRATQNVKNKIEIAKKAMAFIDSGRSLYLDSGSTIMYFAKAIANEHCPIMTSSANIALELVKNPKFSVTLVGGALNQNTLSVSGNLSIEYAKSVNIDIAIMATSGFLLDTGFTSGTFTENELKKTVINKAKKTIMLLDHTKIGRIMPLTFATLQDIDILVTDVEPENALKQECEKHGVKLVF